MQKKIYCAFCGQPLEERLVEGMLRQVCVRCLAIVYENPIPATCLVVRDDSDRILLVKRNVEPRKGFWCLPGGFMELDETPEEAALRELKEETNVTGRLHCLLGVTSSFNPVYTTILMMGYFVNDFTGDPVPGDDASDLNFFPLDNLPEIAFDSHSHFIRLAAAIS